MKEIKEELFCLILCDYERLFLYLFFVLIYSID